MTGQSAPGPHPERTSPRPAAALLLAGPGPQPSARRHRHTSRNRHNPVIPTTHAGAPGTPRPTSDLNLSTPVSTATRQRTHGRVDVLFGGVDVAGQPGPAR